MAQRKCCVRGCGNTNKDLSLFGLPQNREMAKLWIEAIGRDPGQQYLRVCQEHFDHRQIEKHPTCTRLRPGAVPTRFLPAASSDDDDDDDGVDIKEETPEASPECLQRQSSPKCDPKDLATLVALSRTYLGPDLAKCVEIHLMLTQEKKAIAEGNLSDENFLLEALKLRLSFPKTYRMMWRQMGLPSAAGLRRLCRPLTWEINRQWARALCARLSAGAGVGTARGAREVAVCVARTPLRPALGYDAARARLRGLDELDGQQRPRAASAAVVVWARAVHARWQQPLACCLLADAGDLRELWLWIDIIVSKLFDLGLKVRALVTDYGDEHINRARPVAEKLPYFTVKDRQIYRLHDWTEIIIAFRDYLIKHDISFDGKVASWNNVVRLVAQDCCNAEKLAPELTVAHARPEQAPPEQRAALALGALSAPAARALTAAVERGSLPLTALGTAQLFNSVGSLVEILNKKTLPTTKVSPRNDWTVLNTMLTLFEDMTPLESQLRQPEREPSVLAALRGLVRALLALVARAGYAGHTALPTHAFDNGPLHEFYTKCKGQTLATSKPILDGFRKSFASSLMKPLNSVSEREDYGNFMITVESMREVSSKESVLEEPVRMVPLATLRPLLAARRPAELVARLLQQCLEQHPDCAVARVYCSRPALPVPLLELLVRLERHFRAQAAAESPTGLRVLLRRAAEVPFAPPCPCFPVDFLKTLYMSFRIRSLIAHNNTNFRKLGKEEPCVYTVNEIDILNAIL